MGGGHYDGDVASRNRSTRSEVFNYRGHASDAGKATHPERRECHEILNPKSGGGIREAMDGPDHPDTTPIVVAMDVTRSRGDDAKVIYEKLPMFIGQLIMKGYVPHPTISFAAVGDASSGDQAPIQVGQFEADNRLDEQLSKIWLEEGGGGTGQESYELMAYYYAKHSVLACNQRGKKGFFFFLGDEGFYPEVAQDQVKVWIGDELPANIPAPQIFKDLQEKYDVFFIYPKKSWEERKTDIDAEIKKRVETAGGQYSDVDIRASLLWNNRNDLDLHVITPAGGHLFYGNLQLPCGGWLDVDMNVNGETEKPVENIRWKKGVAPAGHYRVYVNNYAFHGGNSGPTPFRVEIEINGEIKHFEGEVPGGRSREARNAEVYEFDYDPSKRPGARKIEDDHCNYDDDKIKAQWANVIPAERILEIEDPRAVIDTMIGAIVLTNGTIDMRGYNNDMKDRGQTETRRNDVKQALSALAGVTDVPKIEIKTGKKESGTVRGGRSSRL